MSDIISPVKFPVSALRGNKGCYLAYYIAGNVHVRLCGDPNPNLEVWGDLPATERSWLPLAALLVGSWEQANDESFHTIFPTRQGAWNVATSGEQKRERAYTYSEFLLNGYWHVYTLMPKACA